MKRIFLLLIIIFILVGFIETADIFGFDKYKPRLEAAFVANEYILSWPKLPYFSYYEVEVLKAPPEDDDLPVPPQQRIITYRTWQNQFTVNETFPFRTYWRVSAHGIFRHPLGTFSNYLNLATVMGRSGEDFQHFRPAVTSAYPKDAPGPDKPVLTWTVIPGAVYYEIEFLSAPPENPNDTMPSNFRVAFSREVFTNGYNPDLSDYPANSIYWRVRALDYDGKPLGVFSAAQQIFIDHTLQVPLKPYIMTVFNDNGMPTPLYPAYSWVPVHGAANYEVELLDQPPENPNGTAPSIHRIWSKEAVGFDCYDEDPRNLPGTYYWRVRGLDAAGNPVGVFSDTGQFVVDLKKGNYAATFGDSITHGGGAVSYSPADWEYSFQTYLTFPVVNLGKSGDTSETMADRFDRDVLPFRPKYLIILGGTNSLRGGIPAGKVIEDLIAIRDKCFAHGIRPIFLTLPPINPDAIMRAFTEETVPDWRQQFDTVNAFVRQQRYYIDLDPQMSDADRELPDYYAIDGLHPDIEGKKIMAQIINANWPRVTR
ncbi:MAG: GDSL-type esterase/lipase family protein [Negativicutes bacterium]|nr:GDSL-type esterase/lipase family protein [Negativicutes bacterium]